MVLLHGWGLNSGVWDEFIELAGQLGSKLRFHPVCLPGYGENVHHSFPADIDDLAQTVLEMAPKNAVWLGWSLGGMVAMRAAVMKNNKNIKGLYLMATSPCFVERSEWVGVPAEVFHRFSKELSSDYRSALAMFLLLQAGSGIEARSIARKAQQRVCRFPDPSKTTLEAGINLLEQTDLRSLIASGALKQVPCHVLSCSLDRVANPIGGERLASMLGSSSRVIKSGHAPFLSAPEDVAEDLLAFCQRASLVE